MLDTLATTAAMHWVGWGAGPVGFGWFFLLVPLFWIGVVILIVALVAGRRRAGWRAGWHGGYGPGYGPGYGRGPWNTTPPAERTLAERFAQGDIDEAEYRARLEVLRANRQTEG
ncbi:MAG: SHOCT domain-containing protein [Microbacteriaceae bacterium]|nr:MAG: SHOCT domain-containing protein [Microbacteriaceae bacterium]